MLRCQTKNLESWGGTTQCIRWDYYSKDHSLEDVLEERGYWQTAVSYLKENDLIRITDRYGKDALIKVTAKEANESQRFHVVLVEKFVHKPLPTGEDYGIKRIHGRHYQVINGNGEVVQDNIGGPRLALEAVKKIKEG